MGEPVIRTFGGKKVAMVVVSLMFLCLVLQSSYTHRLAAGIVTNDNFSGIYSADGGGGILIIKLIHNSI